MKILLSACLAGEKCRYDGKSNYNKALVEALGDYTLIPACPEQLGNLSTPRPPAEISNECVINQEGEDVTAAFKLGAKATLALATENDCKFAVLKANSPSCGCGFVYDGKFREKLIPGDGITATLLKDSGFNVFTEEDIDYIREVINNEKSTI